MTYQPPPQQQPFQQPIYGKPMPPKKKTPVWVFIAAGVGVLLALGLIGSVTGNSNKDKTLPTTVAHAPLTTQAPVLGLVPATTAPAKELTIPDDLVGKNGAIASDELKTLGFTNVTYGSATPGVEVVLLLSNWTVKAVEPAAGTTLPSSSHVVLTMTKNNR